MRRPIYNGHDPGFVITMSEYTEGGHYVHRTDSPCKSTSLMRVLLTYFKREDLIFIFCCHANNLMICFRLPRTVQEGNF